VVDKIPFHVEVFLSKIGRDFKKAGKNTDALAKVKAGRCP